MMRYLITTREANSAFLTNNFDAENHFNADIQMVVYDLIKNIFTTDGIIWNEIMIDHL